MHIDTRPIVKNLGAPGIGGAIAGLLLVLLILTSVTPASAGLITDDFSDGNFTANPVWNALVGIDWTVIGGVLQEPYIDDSVGVLQLTGYSDATYPVYTATADMRNPNAVSGNSTIGFAFNIQDNLNYNWIEVLTGYPGNYLEIGKTVAGVRALVASPVGDVGFTTASPNNITFAVTVDDANRQVGYVITDPSHLTPTGNALGLFTISAGNWIPGTGVGFYNLNGPGFFDNFSITAPEPASAGLFVVGASVLLSRRRLAASRGPA